MEEYSFGDDVEGSDGIIWELDPATSRFTYVSGEAEAMLGYPVATWLSEPGFWERVLHPQDRARTVQQCREAVLRRRDHALEYRAIASDGRVLWLRDHVRVAIDETGAVTKLRGVMVDITDETTERAHAAAAAEDRRMAERVLGVAAVASTVLGAQTLDALVHVLGVTCGDIFSPDLVQLALYDESSDMLEVVSSGTGVHAPGAFRVAGSPIEPVIREGVSLLGTTAADETVAWVGRLPDGQRPEAALHLAVRKGTHSLGLLTVASGIPGQFDAADLAAGDALAGLAAAALVNIGFVAEARATEAALRSSELLLQLLQQATAAANESSTFEEAAARCLAAVCRHTGWPTGHVVRRSGEGEFVSTRLWERHQAAGAPPVAGFVTRIRYEYGMGLVGRVATTGRPVWIADVTREPGFLRTGIGAEVRGAFAFPVRADGEVAAVLEFFSREPVPPDAALMEAAGQIGTQLGRVLERERAQERITFQARLLDAVGQAVVASDAQHRIVYWNRAAETLYGWTREEAVGRTDSEVVDARASAAQTADIVTRLASHQPWSGEFTVRRKDGTIVPVHITGSALYDASGAPAGYLGVATDLSGSKEMETRLRQAQRLEAVGQLAGGVAHYFNNLLTSIKGTVHLLLEDAAPESVHRGDLEEIRRSADRAAQLTAQMLAFSRRQVLQPRVVDLNAELERLRPLLALRAGQRVEVVLELSADLGRVHIDPHQFEQALLQLVTSSCEALNGAGRIVIRTDNITLTPEDARRHPYDVRPGAYVMVCVEDNGAHIDRDELDRIFDPFFTPRNRATAGLGLGTVYGIVKQSGGYIWVDSGRGATTFRLVFPQVSGDVERPTPLTAAAPPRRPQTLLLVEDEDTVRRLAYRILTRQGYTVLQATNGVEALEIVNLYDGPIDLVVTDVVMPEMGGGELAARLRDIRPGTPVLMVSGYAEDAVVREGIAETRGWFLEKPFTPDALIRKVREVLLARQGEMNGETADRD